MPFTQETTFPTDPSGHVIPPDVKVFFTGLMLIRPAADKRTCEVWVHRGAPEHELTIEVRQKQAGRPDVIKMRHTGPLPYAFPPDEVAHPTDPPIHGFKLLVKNAPKGVRSYVGVDTPQGEEAIFEAINFQSAQYHNGRVGGIDEIGGRPSILLNDGLFYVAEKTSRDTNIILERGMSAVTIDPIGSLIGANIYLDRSSNPSVPDDSLLVRWRAQGLLKQLELKKPADGSGISYEVYVINDPLFESEVPGIPPHDEFEEYYKLLREVRPAGTPATTPLKPFSVADQFRLKITPPGGNPHRGSTRIPCMPGIIDP
jgi:hypothetical protein